MTNDNKNVSDIKTGTQEVKSTPKMSETAEKPTTEVAAADKKSEPVVSK